MILIYDQQAEAKGEVNRLYESSAF